MRIQSKYYNFKKWFLSMNKTSWTLGIWTPICRSPKICKSGWCVCPLDCVQFVSFYISLLGLQLNWLAPVICTRQTYGHGFLCFCLLLIGRWCLDGSSCILIGGRRMNVGIWLADHDVDGSVHVVAHDVGQGCRRLVLKQIVRSLHGVRLHR